MDLMGPSCFGIVCADHSRIISAASVSLPTSNDGISKCVPCMSKLSHYAQVIAAKEQREQPTPSSPFCLLLCLASARLSLSHSVTKQPGNRTGPSLSSVPTITARQNNNLGQIACLPIGSVPAPMHMHLRGQPMC